MTTREHTQKQAEELALHRAQMALLAARTPYQRRKALRKLEELRAGGKP